MTDIHSTNAGSLFATGSRLSHSNTRPANRARHTSRAALLTMLAGMMALTGCDSVPSGPPLPPEATRTSPPTVIGEGDMLKFFLPGAPEYNCVQKVRPDGKLNLPLVGEIHAAGKSLRGLQGELTSRYRSQLQNPEVVVSLEASGNPVTITGAVNGPGKFSYDKPTTLFEAIMGAGGFNEFAKRSSVKIIRVVNGQYLVGSYDMTGSALGKLPLVYVRPGDVIYVSD